MKALQTWESRVIERFLIKSKTKRGRTAAVVHALKSVIRMRHALRHRQNVLERVGEAMRLIQTLKQTPESDFFQLEIDGFRRQKCQLPLALDGQKLMFEFGLGKELTFREILFFYRQDLRSLGIFELLPTFQPYNYLGKLPISKWFGKNGSWVRDNEMMVNLNYGQMIWEDRRYQQLEFPNLISNNINYVVAVGSVSSSYLLRVA